MVTSTTKLFCHKVAPDVSFNNYFSFEEKMFYSQDI